MWMHLVLWYALKTAPPLKVRFFLTFWEGVKWQLSNFLLSKYQLWRYILVLKFHVLNPELKIKKFASGVEGEG